MKTWFTWIKENPAEFSLYSGSLLLLIWLAISFTPIQIVFTILLLVIFAFNIWLTKKSVALRLKRLQDLDDSNRKLLLDTKQAFEPTRAVESITENLQFAINFVREIGKGNFNARLEGVNEDNLGLNNANLAGELINMKVQMKTSAEAEQKRVWATQGLANFSDLIRTSTHDAKTLSQEVVIFLVKYLNANQGGVFIVNDEEDSRHFLELKAAYAFERKKYLNKVIELGEGLVGQAYLEKETIHLRKIPQHYVSITSGLGGANPSTLLLIPMKIEEQVLGVIELASFKNFEKHEIEFCEKIAETFASTLSGVKVNERTRQLLEQSQEQSEEMRAQEEEMRQNMEEMQATQEEMARKENSYIARIEKLEIALRETTENADAIQAEATREEVETLTQKLAAQKDRIQELQTEKEKLEKELSASKQQIELPNKWQQTGSDLLQSLEAMHIALAQLKK